MFRWMLGGREAQSSAEKNPVLCIGEDQPKNCFTELQVLKGHFDIVRFLVQIDDFRCASAGDDGLVLVWNIETGERLQELRGHSQQITAITSFTCNNGLTSHTGLITASSDRSLSVSLYQITCLLVLERLCVWLSGGEELCVWNKDFQLHCHRQNHSDTGITALIELPKNCIAAKLCNIRETCLTFHIQLSEMCHRNQVLVGAMSSSDGLFASGSHAGELILWDAIDWNILAYEHILWEESHASAQAEIRLAAPKPSEMSIQHLSTNGKLILAAVGSGLYVYSVQTRTVVAYRKVAHDSNVLHTMLLSDSELMSCSEDGSVRMWEIQDLPLPAEPASPGFFGLWTFGRSNKQTGPPSKKIVDVPNSRTLELTGDLIGHSGAVQMFVSFKENGLVTCSTDHLLILWKNGERQSNLRSLALFQKLEENGGL
uniref:WD repeat domain 41 n=1 Tax=Mastacembelus armatus TaxID=205130 RepID=A0A7N8WUY9_9TELE